MINYKKYLMVLSLFFILILSLGVISASENIDNVSMELDDNLEMSPEDTQEDINDNYELSSINSENDENCLESSNNALLNGGTFDDIQDVIDNSSSGAVIELSGSFNSTGKEIIINKTLTINGNQNTVLDAKGVSGFISFENNEEVAVILNGITFINMDFPLDKPYKCGIHNDNNGIGNYSIVNCNFENNSGFIISHHYIENTPDIMTSYIMSNCNFSNNNNSNVVEDIDNIDNCNFKNNTFVNIYFNSMINCTFEDNIQMSCNGNNVVNCSFINNKYFKLTGKVPIYINSDRWGRGSDCVIDSKFINNICSEGLVSAKSVIKCYFENISNEKKIIGEEYDFPSYSGGEGSAVYISENVINSTFINNQAGRYGGAIRLVDSVFGCVFEKNRAGDSGGAISYVVSVINCTFDDNQANYEGGAISNVVSVINCTFDDNQANVDGGAIYDVELVENCNFMNNKAYGAEKHRMKGGGAIALHTYINPVIKNCNFVNNYAETFGSAIYYGISLDGSGELTIIDSNFTNNNADGKFSTVGYMFKSFGNGTIFLMFDEEASKINLINCSQLEKNSDVFKVKTKITSSSISMNYKDSKYLTITVLGKIYSNPLKGLKIKIKINGDVYEKFTDKNGQIKVLIKNLIPNTYTAEITYAGDNFMVKSSKKVNIVVKKLTPKLTASAKTFKAKLKTKKYSIILKDNNKKAMKKAKVSLKINGKTLRANTDSKGKATFKITKLTKKATYNAKITYAGNPYFNKVSRTVKIKVK